MSAARLPAITLAVAALTALATFALRDAAWLPCTLDGLRRGELWRLLSGALLHANAGHAARDLGSLLLLGALYERRLGWRFPAALALGAALAPLAAFAADPTLAGLYGLSGAVHALWVAGLVFEWRRAGGRPGALVVALSLALAIKLVVEAASGAPLWPIDYPAGVRPAPACHLGGALGGALATAWGGLSFSAGSRCAPRRRLRRSPSPPAGPGW